MEGHITEKFIKQNVQVIIKRQSGNYALFSTTTKTKKATNLFICVHILSKLPLWANFQK